MRLALFDLDNTLLAGDSDYEWGQFLVDRGILEREAYEAQNRAYYEQYVAGTLDIHEYLGFALRPLAEHTPQDLARWHAEFMRTRIVPMIAAGARALVGAHLAAGDLCAIVTSTNRDRKSTRLNSSHVKISYAVFCLKKKKIIEG